MERGNRGRRYFRTALSVALGAGAALGGAFLVSRVTEKQGAETRMGRLEGMLEKLGEGAAEKKKPAPRPKPKAKPTK
jgi:hypothetical protein